VVVHALRTARTGAADPEIRAPGGTAAASSPPSPLVGFVVTKAVGNAVHRNRVRRRLRHLALPHLAGLSVDTMVVVRALPPAATATAADLGRELGSAWSAALVKLGER